MIDFVLSCDAVTRSDEIENREGNFFNLLIMYYMSLKRMLL
jgi:hypothetical protein